LIVCPEGYATAGARVSCCLSFRALFYQNPFISSQVSASSEVTSRLNVVAIAFKRHPKNADYDEFNGSLSH